MFNKVLYSDDGTLYDKTSELTDYSTGELDITFVAADDKIYLGSKYPFTRKYFKVTGTNDTDSVASVRYWDGAQWRSATNVLDGTSSEGAALAGSGYLSWETDKRYPWARDDTTVDGSTRITDLGSITLYDFYWVEISFSADMTVTISWAGDLFCTDTDLGAEYPDLNRSAVMTAFASTKTSWEEQRIVASRLVAQDLRRVWKPGASERLLGQDQLRGPTVARTAELIFNAMDGQAEKAVEARKEYERRMDPRYFSLDENDNGRADTADVSALRVVRMYR